MRRITVIAGMLAVGLSACDPAPVAQNTTVAAKPDGMEAKIDALDEPLQRTTFFRAIRDGGYTCQRIVRFAKQRPVGGFPTWIAECEDKGQYVIALHRDGIFWVSGVPQTKR